MTSPFLNKSPAELKAMLPDLGAPELDALCAKYCDGLRVNWGVTTWTHEVPIVGQENLYPLHAHRSVAIPSYTSDGREAMRLQTKYKFDTMWLDKYEEYHDVWAAISVDIPQPVISSNPCRAITEAAVAIELTKMIEEDHDTSNE